MKPRISVNQLGEYMTATPSRRRQIVRDQKNPPLFKSTRYRDAREAIADHIASNMVDDEAALAAAQALRENTDGSDFVVQDRIHSAHAITAFLDICEDMKLGALTAVRVDTFSSDGLEIAGVKVVMRPEALLLDPATQEVVGCVKLHFSRTQPLDGRSAAYVATALRAHLEQNLSSPGTVNPDRCYVVDIATRSILSAPKANKRRLGDLGAACEEIKDRWVGV